MDSPHPMPPSPLAVHVLLAVLAACGTVACVLLVLGGVADGSGPGDAVQQLFAWIYLPFFALALVIALLGVRTRALGFATSSAIVLGFCFFGGPLLVALLVGSWVS